MFGDQNDDTLVSTDSVGYETDFLRGGYSKASVYNAGDPGLIPGSGRSSGEGNGPAPVFLPGKSHRLQSIGLQRDRHNLATEQQTTILEHGIWFFFACLFQFLSLMSCTFQCVSLLPSWLNLFLGILFLLMQL